MGWVEKIKHFFGMRVTVVPNITIIEKNFSRVEEKEDPKPAKVDGLEVERYIRKVTKHGNSSGGVNFKQGEIALIANQGYVRVQFVTEHQSEDREYKLLVSKPSDKELP